MDLLHKYLVMVSTDNHLINITPHPCLAGLNRTHDRMTHAVEMFGCVFILRIVTAANMAANHAHPQVDPGIPHFQTLFAAIRAGDYIPNLITVFTSPVPCHHALFS
jgi:hypothetical protein